MKKKWGEASCMWLSAIFGRATRRRACCGKPWILGTFVGNVDSFLCLSLVCDILFPWYHFFFFFLGLHPFHVEVPRLGAQSEL